MVNRNRGEIEAMLDDKKYELCLTLGALARLEEALQVHDLKELTEKFTNGTLAAGDILKIISAGLYGAGHEISEDDIAKMRVEGGLNGYVKIAVELIEATFSTPDNSSI